MSDIYERLDQYKYIYTYKSFRERPCICMVSWIVCIYQRQLYNWHRTSMCETRTICICQRKFYICQITAMCETITICICQKILYICQRTPLCETKAIFICQRKFYICQITAMCDSKATSNCQWTVLSLMECPSVRLEQYATRCTVLINVTNTLIS